MLFVFHVDTGLMLTLDMRISMETVSALQDALEKNYKISVENQILLISGGETLSPGERVGSYSAGMDTNPIYLFSRSTIESHQPPAANIRYGSESDLREQLVRSLNMPAKYETVKVRAHLAQKFCDASYAEIRICQSLVRDQHLQHQGWAAVTANLADITSDFKKTHRVLQTMFKEFLQSSDQYSQVISEFPSTLLLLSKIPLLPSLTYVASAGSGRRSRRQSEAEVDIVLDEQDEQPPQTLLQWISATPKDSGGTLDQLYHECKEKIHDLDDAVRATLDEKATEVLRLVDNHSMQEVGGLGDRLSKQEGFIIEGNQIVQDQEELSKSFTQNLQRAKNLGDTSVLPDLCVSHRKQLNLMLENHERIKDTHRKCVDAKKELSVNLHTRLRWVMCVEKEICSSAAALILYIESLKKLKRKLGLLCQIHCAPSLYTQSVVEVVRRKEFSHLFTLWAGGLVKESETTRQEELTKREEFSKRLKNHFLQTLFPGFEDTVPHFANDMPSPFDNRLPPVTGQDVTYLQNSVPELQDIISFPQDDLGVFQRLSTMSSIQSPSFMGRSHRLTSGIQGSDLAASDIVVLRGGFNTSSPPNQDFRPAFEMRGAPQSSYTPIPEDECGSQTPIQNSSPNKTDDQNCGQETSTSSDIETINVQEDENLLTDSTQTTKACDKTCSHGDNHVSVHDTSNPPDASSALVADVFPSPLSDDDEFYSLLPDGALDIPSARAGSQDAEHSSTSSHTASSSNTSKQKIATTPPDNDEMNSEGFMSADFYIDESLPSSMTDSPSSKRLQELQMLLQEKSVMLDSRDKEICKHQEIVVSLQDQVEQIGEKNKCIEKIVEQSIAQMKDSLKGFDDQFKQEHVDLAKWLQSTTEGILQKIVQFDESSSQQTENELVEVKKEHQTIVEEWKEKLNSAEESFSKLEVQLQAKIDNIDELKLEKQNLVEQHSEKMEELRITQTATVDELQKKLILEHELELENTKEVYDGQLNDYELQIEAVNQELQITTEKLRNVEKDLEAGQEDLRVKLQEEKDQLRKAMADDFEAKTIVIQQKVKDDLCDEHKIRVEKLQQQHCTELEEKADVMKKELEQVQQKQLNEEKQQLTDELTARLNTEHSEHTAQLLDRQREALERGYMQQRDEQNREHHGELSTLRGELAEIKNVEIKDMEERLIELHTDETSQLEKQIEELKLSLSEQNKQLQTQNIQLEEHKNRVASLQEAAKPTEGLKEQVAREKEMAAQQAVSELQVKHNEELAELRGELKQKQDQQMSAMKSSMTAEKQVVFNEALSKITTEKDHVIDRLKREIRHLNRKLQECTNKKTTDPLEKILEDLKESALYSTIERMVREMKSHHDNDLVRLQSWLESLDKRSTNVSASMIPKMVLSTPLPVSAQSSSDDGNLSEEHREKFDSGLELDEFDVEKSFTMAHNPQMTLSLYSHVRHLESTLHKREKESYDLQEKVMQLSSIRPPPPHDRVAINSCERGDIVLLCLDERHDHYVVFHMGGILHFLHADSLQGLGLSADSKSDRKSWVLAEIINKEYCHARKANNRFKVPLGTKFYRVWAKPWSTPTTGSRSGGSRTQDRHQPPPIMPIMSASCVPISEIGRSRDDAQSRDNAESRDDAHKGTEEEK